jgi:hypothetical protein
MSSLINKRFICPCCGYPTIDEKASYDICILCYWEDDGQDDLDADLIRGGLMQIIHLQKLERILKNIL